MATTTNPAPTVVPLTQGVGRAIEARLTKFPAWVVLSQLFLGFGWLRAAAEKIIDPQWWTGEAIEAFVAEHADLTVGWYQPFVDIVVVPAAIGIALIVLVAQLFAASSLLTARHMAAGLAVGMFLNVNFVAAGAVNPSAFYLLTQGALALWLAEQSRSGRSLRRLGVAAVVAATLGVASLPFVSTIDPAGVIDDPAVMLAFGGLLTFVACDAAHRRSSGGRGLP